MKKLVFLKSFRTFRFIKTLVCVLILASATSVSALSLDAISSKAQNTSTATWSHATGNGLNTVLFVTVILDQGNVTTVKYNGTSLSLFNSYFKSNIKSYVYVLNNPAVGTNNIEIKLSSGSSNVIATAATYFGVNQSTPLVDLYSTYGSSSNPSISYSSRAGTALVMLGTESGNPTPATTTELVEVSSSSKYNNLSEIVTSGSVNLNYTFSSAPWLLVTGIINPSGPVALPVTMLDLSVKLVNQKPLLQWKTSAEENVKEFEIYQSFNGIDFSLVGSVQAQANAQFLKSYNFSDLNHSELIEGPVFYKIKTIDNNASYTWSIILNLNVDAIEKTTKITSLYPNPSHGILNIAIESNSDSEFEIQIIDVFGKVYQSINSKDIQAVGTITLDLNGLDNGIYFIKLTESNGASSTTKFLKN